MTDKQKTFRLPAFFDKDPELKKRILEFDTNYQATEEEKQKSFEAVKKFVEGEVTWAEIRNIPKRLLKALAGYGYDKYKKGELDKAEKLFKGLAVIDHTNWYYRSALGSIFQKQKLFEEAADEYSLAIELNENEVSNFLRRGQCYMQLEDWDAALEDFVMIRSMGLKDDSPWLKKANALAKTILTMQRNN